MPDEAGPGEQDAGAPQQDAGGHIDAGALHDAGGLVDASGTSDARAGEDAGSAPDAALPACEPRLEEHELYVFDTEGPTVLLGTPHAADWTQQLTGTVVQQGTGFPVNSAPSSVIRPERPDEFRFLRVAGTGHSWTIAIRDIGGFGVRDGAAVDVRLAYEWGGFSPEHTTLSIRSAGQLAFLYVLGGSVASLPVPEELHVAQGSATCVRDDSCGSWSSYALEIGDARTAPKLFLPGQVGPAGAFTVTHAGDRQQTSNGGCPDWFVSRAHVIASRSHPLPVAPAALAPCANKACGASCVHCADGGSCATIAQFCDLDGVCRAFADPGECPAP